MTAAAATLPELYAKHRAGLRRYLARMIGEADAEDLLHDVFERAQAAAQDAVPSAGWLYRIARNAAVDALRGRAVRAREAVRESLSDETPSDTLGITVGSAKIRLHRARRALRELIECECRTYRDQRNELGCEPVRSSTLRVLA